MFLETKPNTVWANLLSSPSLAIAIFSLRLGGHPRTWLEGLGSSRAISRPTSSLKADHHRDQRARKRGKTIASPLSTFLGHICQSAVGMTNVSPQCLIYKLAKYFSAKALISEA